MSLQNTTIVRNNNENEILNLEKKYFNIIKDIILCNDFYKDIKLIEKETSDNYTNLPTVTRRSKA